MKKARKVRWNVLAAIDYVCQHTKGKQLKYDNTVKMQNSLNRLKAYFGGINENQVIILCAVLDITLSHLEKIGISEYLGMAPLSYLQHNDEIEDLDERGLLEVQINDTGYNFSIEQKMVKCILRNTEINIEQEKYEKSLIQPDSIVSKPLFYSKDNQEQIDMLYSSLQHENLSFIQNGLRAKGLPTGICVLLYGAPGTGKTESVYQIAKATHRQIVHVDISQTKSCWFGESEKMIDKIFENYKRICKRLRDSGKNDIPILLFNEADAILQKRTEFRGGGTEKTENAMQNILLEKMENFDGILIATTNLAVNMDVAFERRFLYKIKFDNPTVEAKTSIWQSKLSWLPESQVRQLANEYNFSGGEIENVVRKATMEEIIKGSRVSITRLEEICNTEKLNNCESEKKIGFCL